MVVDIAHSARFQVMMGFPAMLGAGQFWHHLCLGGWKGTAKGLEKEESGAITDKALSSVSVEDK